MMIFNLHPYKTREEFDGIRSLIAGLGFRTSVSDVWIINLEDDNIRDEFESVFSDY